MKRLILALLALAVIGCGDGTPSTPPESVAECCRRAEAAGWTFVQDIPSNVFGLRQIQYAKGTDGVPLVMDLAFAGEAFGFVSISVLPVDGMAADDLFPFAWSGLRRFFPSDGPLLIRAWTERIDRHDAAMPHRSGVATTSDGWRLMAVEYTGPAPEHVVVVSGARLE